MCNFIKFYRLVLLLLVMGVPGLLADNINMIAKTTKYMTENNLQTKYDPLAVPIPWNEQVGSQYLRNGCLLYFVLFIKYDLAKCIDVLQEKVENWIFHITAILSSRRGHGGDCS